MPSLKPHKGAGKYFLATAEWRNNMDNEADEPREPRFDIREKFNDLYGKKKLFSTGNLWEKMRDSQQYTMITFDGEGMVIVKDGKVEISKELVVDGETAVTPIWLGSLKELIELAAHQAAAIEKERKEISEWLNGWCEHTTNPKQRRYLCKACRQSLGEEKAGSLLAAAG
jgi:hypothetical protein